MPFLQSMAGGFPVGQTKHEMCPYGIHRQEPRATGSHLAPGNTSRGPPLGIHQIRYCVTGVPWQHRALNGNQGFCAQRGRWRSGAATPKRAGLPRYSPADMASYMFTSHTRLPFIVPTQRSPRADARCWNWLWQFCLRLAALMVGTRCSGGEWVETWCCASLQQAYRRGCSLH